MPIRSSQAATAKRHVAEDVAGQLSRLPGVLGILLYGSVARGDANQFSDVDLLVLKDDLLDSDAIAGQFRAQPGGEFLSIQFHTNDELIVHLKRAPLFALHLRHDGVVLYDPDSQIAELVRTEYPFDLHAELAIQRRNLDLYRDVYRFGSALTLPLARVYSVGRAAVFLRLQETSIIEFDVDRAITKLARARPEWTESLNTIREAKPFYQAVRMDVEIESVEIGEVDVAGSRERLRRTVHAVADLLEGRDQT